MYLCIYIATHLHKVYLDWLQAVLESRSNGTWRLWLSELRDTLALSYSENLEIHLEAVIEQVLTSTGRRWSSELRDAPGGRNQGSLEMHWKAIIVRILRPRLVEFIDALGGRNQVKLWDALAGRDWASLEMHLEAMMEQDWRSTWRRSIGGSPGAATLSIILLTHNRGNVIRWMYLWASHRELAGSSRSWRETHWKLKLHSGVKG